MYAKVDLPSNLKTEEKLNLLNTFGQQLTEIEYVQLLRYKMTINDYGNFDYLIKHFDLKLDNNKMIIFTEEFAYNDISPQALYFWWMIKLIKENYMLSKMLKLNNISDEEIIKKYILSRDENGNLINPVVDITSIFNNLNITR